MSPRFVLGRENVPCVAEVVNRSLKADCTDFKTAVSPKTMTISTHLAISNSMSSFVPKYWLNWQILVAIFD